jgi:hypothetical protein
MAAAWQLHISPTLTHQGCVPGNPGVMPVIGYPDEGLPDSPRSHPPKPNVYFTPYSSESDRLVHPCDTHPQGILDAIPVDLGALGQMKLERRPLHTPMYTRRASMTLSPAKDGGAGTPPAPGTPAGGAAHGGGPHGAPSPLDAPQPEAAGVDPRLRPHNRMSFFFLSKHRPPAPPSPTTPHTHTHTHTITRRPQPRPRAPPRPPRASCPQMSCLTRQS